MKKFISFVWIFVLIIFPLQNTKAQSDSKNIQVGPQPDGSFLVPSNQLLRPAGLQLVFPGRPVDLVQTPDRKLLLVKNRNSVNVIRIEDRTILQSLNLEKNGCSFTGICLSADGKQVFVTDAKNLIHVASFDESRMLRWEKPIQLPSPQLAEMLCQEDWL